MKRAISSQDPSLVILNKSKTKSPGPSNRTGNTSVLTVVSTSKRITTAGTPRIQRFQLPEAKRTVGSLKPNGKILDQEDEDLDSTTESMSSELETIPCEEPEKLELKPKIPPATTPLARPLPGQGEGLLQQNSELVAGREGNQEKSQPNNLASLSKLLLPKTYSEEDYVAEMHQIREYLSSKKIYCARLKASKSSKKENLTILQSYIQLSKDHTTLEFINRTFQTTLEDGTSVYLLQKSGATCKLADIESFTLCGQSPAFDLARKYLLAYPQSKTDMLPFSSWQCLTLKLKDKNIELIIKNEEHLRLFIKLLVFSLRSLDGAPNSFNKLLQIKETQARRMSLLAPKRSSQRRSTKAFLPTLGTLRKMNEWKIYRLACRRFFMLTVQAKLSLMAYSKNMTIKELFYRTVCYTFQQLHPEEHFLYPVPEVGQWARPVDLDQTKKMIMQAISEYVSFGDKVIKGPRHGLKKRKTTKKIFDLNKLKELDKITDSLSDSNLAYQVYYNEHQQRKTFMESKYALHRALVKQVVLLLMLDVLCGIDLAQVKLQRLAIERELDHSSADRLGGWLIMPKALQLDKSGHTLVFYDMMEAVYFQNKYLKIAFQAFAEGEDALTEEPSPGTEIDGRVLRHQR